MLLVLQQQLLQLQPGRRLCTHAASAPRLASMLLTWRHEWLSA